ncbi:MAG TPA: YggT family protein, partial [Rhodopila sp.]
GLRHGAAMMLQTGPTGFIFFIVNALLDILTWAIIINAVASWLVAFNVVNPRNQVVNMILRGLDALTRPVLWPLRKIIPPLGGGIDITPIIALLIIQGFQMYLLPPIIVWCYGLIG